MKIAITSTGKEMSCDVAELFGRCPYFIVGEIEDGKIIRTEILKNESENQSSGAGISAAKLLAENNIDAVIAQTIGPRAMDVLKQFNIEVYNGEGKISEVIQKFIDKKFKK
jgi:predicted Fe-Mo cluster-binding NifX family protein